MAVGRLGVLLLFLSLLSLTVGFLSLLLLMSGVSPVVSTPTGLLQTRSILLLPLPWHIVSKLVVIKNPVTILFLLLSVASRQN